MILEWKSYAIRSEERIQLTDRNDQKVTKTVGESKTSKRESKTSKRSVEQIWE